MSASEPRDVFMRSVHQVAPAAANSATMAAARPGSPAGVMPWTWTSNGLAAGTPAAARSSAIAAQTPRTSSGVSSALVPSGLRASGQTPSHRAARLNGARFGHVAAT